jgi:Ni/Fe-hydrogenase subunit HybB-like protein
MSDHALRDEVLRKLQRPLPAWLMPLLWLLALVGVASFVLLALGSSSARVWRAYHVNWLFWTGLSQAGVVFAASQIISGSRWSHPVRRMAEASAAFLPISFVLFVALWLGRVHIFPWVAAPVEEWPKGFWLRDWFVFGRDGAGLILMYGLSFWFLYHSLRPDAALLREGAPPRLKKLYGWLARGWGAAGDAGAAEAQRAFSEARLSRLAPGLVVAYAVVMSILAFDLVMSLAPHWLSNLLGAYFFMAAWLMGLMALALTSIFWRRHHGLDDLITSKTLHDLGKLCFAFTVFWAYLFFSQFIVIWYGNMPEETSFMMLRLAQAPWRPIGILMVVLVFVVPFWGLMGVKPKQTPAILGTFAVISLAGLWLDRWVFVVPSIVQTAARAPLGWPELLVTAGFAGVWGLAHAWFAATFPIVSPLLLEKMEREGAGHH